MGNCRPLFNLSITSMTYQPSPNFTGELREIVDQEAQRARDGEPFPRAGEEAAVWVGCGGGDGQDKCHGELSIWKHRRQISGS